MKTKQRKTAKRKNPLEARIEVLEAELKGFSSGVLSRITALEKRLPNPAYTPPWYVPSPCGGWEPPSSLVIKSQEGERTPGPQPPSDKSNLFEKEVEEATERATMFLVGVGYIPERIKQILRDNISKELALIAAKATKTEKDKYDFLEPVGYVAANLQEALKLSSFSGDWYGQLLRWAEKNAKGFPNKTAGEMFRMKFPNLAGLVDTVLDASDHSETNDLRAIARAAEGEIECL